MKESYMDSDEMNEDSPIDTPFWNCEDHPTNLSALSTWSIKFGPLKIRIEDSLNRPTLYHVYINDSSKPIRQCSDLLEAMHVGAMVAYEHGKSILVDVKTYIEHKRTIETHRKPKSIWEDCTDESDA